MENSGTGPNQVVKVPRYSFLNSRVRVVSEPIEEPDAINGYLTDWDILNAAMQGIGVKLHAAAESFSAALKAAGVSLDVLNVHQDTWHGGRSSSRGTHRTVINKQQADELRREEMEGAIIPWNLFDEVVEFEPHLHWEIKEQLPPTLGDQSNLSRAERRSPPRKHDDQQHGPRRRSKKRR